MVKSRTLIIAEAGVNHNGSLKMALELVDAAADSGADIVKFQTFQASALTAASAPKAEYQIHNTQSTESQLEMLKKLELKKEDHFTVKSHCEKRGIEFLSTPFEVESLKFLVSEVGLKRLKLPSGEITNGPFLLAAARTKLPLIISTGMSTMEEIGDALSVVAFGLLNSAKTPDRETLRDFWKRSEAFVALKDQVVLLHCVTEYPAPLSQVNLLAMKTMSETFELGIGYSDHTLGIGVSIGAVALGARVIEKHFTLDKNLPGPDHLASLTPNELKEMVKGIREVETALGSFKKQPGTVELKNREVVRKSLMASAAIREGDVFSENNLTSKRPGSGISPMLYWDYLGQRSRQNYQSDDLIRCDE